jgi:hypothetical protein
MFWTNLILVIAFLAMIAGLVWVLWEDDDGGPGPLQWRRARGDRVRIARKASEDDISD